MEQFGISSSSGPFAKTDKVIVSINTLSKEAVLSRTEVNLRRILYPAQATSMPNGRGKRLTNHKFAIVSRWNRRRAEYARVHTGFKKNR